EVAMKETSASGRHERFRELSALASTGVLTASEWSELNDHLRACDECREIHDQYRGLDQAGMPMLAALSASGEEENAWNAAATRRNLFARVREAERNSRPGTSLLAAFLRDGFRVRLSPLSIAVLAACLLLFAGAVYHVTRITHSTAKTSIASD